MVASGASRRDRRRGDRLRRRQRAAERRRRRVGVDGDVAVARDPSASPQPARRDCRAPAAPPAAGSGSRPRSVRHPAPRRSALRPAPVACTRSSATGSARLRQQDLLHRRVRRIDGASARVAAAARSGAARRRSAAGSRLRRPALAPSADCSVWRSTISAALRSGTPVSTATDTRRQRRLEKQPGLLERGLDVAAVEVLIEAGLLRQHLRDRLLQFRRQAGRTRRQRRDWQTAAPDCPARWPRSAPPSTPPRAPAASARSSARRWSGGWPRHRPALPATASRRRPMQPAASPPCPTIASRMPSLVCDTASCRVWPSCSGISESTSIDRLAIAIRTRSAASTFSTCALTTLPGCSTSSGARRQPAANSWAASTGSTGLMEIAIVERSRRKAKKR